MRSVFISQTPLSLACSCFLYLARRSCEDSTIRFAFPSPTMPCHAMPWTAMLSNTSPSALKYAVQSCAMLRCAMLCHATLCTRFGSQDCGSQDVLQGLGGTGILIFMGSGTYLRKMFQGRGPERCKSRTGSLVYRIASHRMIVQSASRLRGRGSFSEVVAERTHAQFALAKARFLALHH